MMDVITVFILLSATVQSYGQTIEKSVSACFGTQVDQCDFYELECDVGYKIRIRSAIYGLKEGNCKKDKRRCLRATDGCCVYHTADCMESFSDLHLYTLYRECSWRQSCGPLQATRNVLNDCDNKPSTYVHIEYECVPDVTLLPFCSDENTKGTEVNIVFDGAMNTYKDRTKCECFVFTTVGNVDVYFVDLRMIKKETSNSGSDCSSAALTYYPSSTRLPQCSNDKNEEENFINHGMDSLSGDLMGFVLSDLHQGGPDDKPTMVWLSLSAPEEAGMLVTCAGPGTTLIPPTTTYSYTVSSNPTNGTADSAIDDGGNTAAVVAGVLIPIILLVIAGVVVGYIFWKRKKKGTKGKRTAQPNSYTEDMNNGTNNEIYDEIGIVGDAPEPPIYDPVYEPPIYDPVYEPGTRGSTSSTNSKNNGPLHADQPRLSNVSDVQIPIKAPKKHSKNPFRVISARTDRLFNWFRNQRDTDNAKGKNRGREVSHCSYDHIHGASPVIVEVTTPPENEGHEYSHTNGQPSVSNPVERSPKGGRISRDLSAVHAGDSYIEFTFDTVDRNDPKLLKAPPSPTNTRLKPPSRPLPSPSGSPKISPKSSSPLLARPKSPALLSPLTEGDNDDRPAYDYAESQPNSRRASDASESAKSDHSYKVLEKQPEYDYAAAGDDDNDLVEISNDHDYSGSSMYEDVDAKSRTESCSSSDVQDYEVPVKSQNGSETAPVSKKPMTPKTPNNDSPNMSKLNEELLEASKLKPLKPVGDSSPKLGAKKDNVSANAAKKDNLKAQVVSKQPTKTSKSSNPLNHEYVNAPKKSKGNKTDTKGVPLEKTTREEPAHTNAMPSSGLMKSDNVKTKDYEKADNLKGVRNMAKLFETK